MMIEVKKLLQELNAKFPINEDDLKQLDEFKKVNGLSDWPRLPVEFVGNA